MLEANDMVEAKLAEIRERKMYEMKRMFAAKMYEGVGGLTKAEIEARKKAGYKKASDVLGDPRDKNKSDRLNPGAKIIKKKVSEEALDEAGLAPSTRRAKLYKYGLQAIRNYENRKKEKSQAKANEPDYPDTPTGRNRRKADERLANKEGPESGKTAWERSAGGKMHGALKRLGSSQITQDVKDIAFRNI